MASCPTVRRVECNRARASETDLAINPRRVEFLVPSVKMLQRGPAQRHTFDLLSAAAPALVLLLARGGPGLIVQLEGLRFPTTSVDLYWDTVMPANYLGQVMPETDGSFTALVTIPSSALLGAHNGLAHRLQVRVLLDLSRSLTTRMIVACVRA